MAETRCDGHRLKGVKGQMCMVALAWRQGKDSGEEISEGNCLALRQKVVPRETQPGKRECAHYGAGLAASGRLGLMA